MMIKQQTDIVAEAILAGEKVKKNFSFPNGCCSTGNFLAIFSWFAKNLLVRDGPSDAGNRDCDDEEINNLRGEIHRNCFLK